MNQYWKERYFNRKNWILEENYRLDLTALETLVLLNIEHFNEFNLLIDLSLMSNVCHSTQTEIDKVLTKLINKGYLKIEMLKDKVLYNTDGLYQITDIKKDDQSTDIIEIYEHEFKRPLSAAEIDKLNYWLTQLEYAFLIHALREAAIYRKLSFSYIERILIDWTKNKVTLEQLNSGKRNDR
jgi:DnaD/phage-associated family protein